LGEEEERIETGNKKLKEVFGGFKTYFMSPHV